MRPISIQVEGAKQSYDIVVGDKILGDLAKRIIEMRLGSDAVIITNPIIQQHHGAALCAGLREEGLRVKTLTVESGEQSKSADVAFDLIRQIADGHAGRDVFIIAFGGGVVGDLAGFVAAVYRRGIPYIQVPTTLLAQIDSAMGGKVAVDLPFGKNLVGAFYHPHIVYSDISLLKTLDERQIRSGLAEAIKYGVICDARFFDFLESHRDALLGLDSKCFLEMVAQCSRIKASLVSRDEKEHKGMRTILNFGHTAGHAIETACGYEKYNHGEAIALGMRIAAEISSKLELVSAQEVARLNLILDRFGLPDMIQGASLDDILNAMKHDKKFQGGHNRLVLMTGIGRVKVQERIDEGVIKDAIEPFIRSQSYGTPEQPPYSF